MTFQLSSPIKYSIFCYLLLCCFSVQSATPQAPAIAASSYVLVDYYSGEVIAQDNQDLSVAPASLTKMMTSYVVSHEISVGNITLEEDVLISEKAWAQNPVFKGSSLMWLEAGKQVKVKELLKGLVISSGNDAAVALAEHVAGSEEAFTELMNQTAQTLGMKNSYFENAHGLSATQHKTTAADMAKLGVALIRDFPKDFSLYKEKEYTYNAIQTYNRHPLLSDPSLQVDGIKTGHTDEAGYCLVTSATKGNMRLIAVVMGTKGIRSRKSTSKRILSYGFRFFETVKPLEAGKLLTKARIWMGQQNEIELGLSKDVYVSIPRGKSSDLNANFVVEKNLSAPITKGQKVGKVSFMLGSKVVAEHSLVALQSIEEAGFVGRSVDSVEQWFNSLFD